MPSSNSTRQSLFAAMPNRAACGIAFPAPTRLKRLTCCLIAFSTARECALLVLAVAR